MQPRRRRGTRRAGCSAGDVSPRRGAQRGLCDGRHGAAGQPASSWELTLQNTLLELRSFLTLPAENGNHHVQPRGGGVRGKCDNHRNRFPMTACANAAFLFSVLLFSFMLMSSEKHYTKVAWSTLHYYHTVRGQNTEVCPIKSHSSLLMVSTYCNL